MIRSVRFKIFVVFVVLLLSFQGSYLILNTFFIDDLFMDANRESMSKAHQAMISYLESDLTVEDAVDFISNDYGFMPTVISDEMEIVYTVAPHMISIQRNQPRNQLQGRLPPPPEGTPPGGHFNPNTPPMVAPGLVDMVPPGEVFKNVRDLIDQPEVDYLFNVSDRPEGVGEEVIQFVGRLPDNQYMIIDKGTSGIKDSSAMVTRIINMAIVGTFLLGSVIVYFVSGRLAKPFIEMNKTALNIADLKFDNKLNIRSKDEIGTLAKSINIISDKLNRALTDLRKC